MTDNIKMPPMPLAASSYGMSGEYTQSQMRAYAREAVRLNATVPDEPDWRHPKIQGLIGSEARLRITIDLMWQILEDPNQEFTASDMEYWDTIHDKLKAALSAAQDAPAQAAQAVPQGWKLVPVEPTDEMVRSTHHLDLSYMTTQWAVDRAAVYRAMLAAAPAAPQPAAQQGELQATISRFERQAHRMGELWERCQGKGWPEKESAEFHRLRDELVPASRAALTAQAQEAAPVTRWKDHNTAQLVNTLTRLAVDYRDTQQLRERIAQVIRPMAAQLAAAPAAQGEPSDTERLDWLEAQNADLDHDAWLVLGHDCEADEDCRKHWVGANLRRAIDAARAAQQEGGA